MIRRREHPELIAMAIAILGIGMLSQINIGLRHILPIYGLLSMMAAFALVNFWRLGAILAVWLLIGSALAHPDYLPWFNALAGRHPERIAIDSNLDWGQDMFRLRDECRRRNISALGTLLFGWHDARRIGLPPTYPIDSFKQSGGWIAVSETAITHAQAEDPLKYFWLTEKRPFHRVGKTIRLYEVR